MKLNACHHAYTILSHTTPDRTAPYHTTTHERKGFFVLQGPKKKQQKKTHCRVCVCMYVYVCVCVSVKRDRERQRAKTQPQQICRSFFHADARNRSCTQSGRNHQAPKIAKCPCSETSKSTGTCTCPVPILAPYLYLHLHLYLYLHRTFHVHVTVPLCTWT